MKLFNSPPKNLHNSLNDVLICLRCYYMLEHKKLKKYYSKKNIIEQKLLDIES